MRAGYAPAFLPIPALAGTPESPWVASTRRRGIHASDHPAAFAQARSSAFRSNPSLVTR